MEYDDEEARTDAEWMKAVLRVRKMLSQAQSSEYPEEIETYTRKAMRMAEKFEIDDWLLEAPGADLDLVVVGAQLRRLNTIMAEYQKYTKIEYEDQTREWTEYLRQYDAHLERAADLLNVPIPQIPTGVVRHFRPEMRQHIEKLILEAGYDVSAQPGFDPLAAAEDEQDGPEGVHHDVEASS